MRARPEAASTMARDCLEPTQGFGPRPSRDLPVGAGIASGELRGPLPDRVVWSSAAMDDLREVAVAGATAVAISHSGTAVGFDPGSGRERWRVDLDVFDTLSLDAREDLALVGGGTAAIAVDPSSGEELWRFMTTPPNPDLAIPGSTVVGPDTVLLSGTNGTDRALFAVDPAGGEHRWCRRSSLLGATFDSGRGLVVVHGKESAVAYAVTDGARQWDRALDGTDTFAAPLVTGNAVVIGTELHVFRLALEDGEEQWRNEVGAVSAMPAAAGGLLIVSVMDPQRTSGELVVLDAEAGEVLWRREVAGPVAAPPVVRDGTAFVATLGGTLEAFALDTARRSWIVEFGAPATGIALDGDGLLVAAGGALHRVATESMEVSRHWHQIEVRDTSIE